jgi:thioredoxin 2
MENETVIVVCEKCGTKNRVPAARIEEGPVCGKCRAPLDAGASSVPFNVTDRSFENEIISFSGVVLVDCWAPWCGPCRMVAPVLDQLAKEYKGRVRIAKLNTDENPAISAKYSIQSIPTMLIFKGGKLADRLVGALPKQEIERHLAPLL